MCLLRISIAIPCPGTRAITIGSRTTRTHTKRLGGRGRRARLSRFATTCDQPVSEEILTGPVKRLLTVWVGYLHPQAPRPISRHSRSCFADVFHNHLYFLPTLQGQHAIFELISSGCAVSVNPFSGLGSWLWLGKALDPARKVGRRLFPARHFSTAFWFATSISQRRYLHRARSEPASHQRTRSLLWSLLLWKAMTFRPPTPAAMFDFSYGAQNLRWSSLQLRSTWTRVTSNSLSIRVRSAIIVLPLLRPT